MRITKKLQIVALAALSLGFASVCSAQSDAPYTEGPVWNITMVKAKAATPQDFDILLMVESKNMAALDNAREKFDPIARKIVGTTDQQQAIQVKRLDVREIMGTKLMREITLK